MHNSLTYRETYANFFVFLLLAFFAFVSCKTDPKGGKAPPAPVTPTYFYRLKLTKANYDSLKLAFTGNSPNNQVVFQFYYPASPTGRSPSLYGYAMKPGHQTTGKAPVILDYDSVTTEPLTGRAQVLGDLQLRMKSFDTLLNQIGGGVGKDYYFLFTPKFRAINPHEYYSVSLFENTGSTFKEYPITVDCDPSPPYSAF